MQSEVISNKSKVRSFAITFYLLLLTSYFPFYAFAQKAQKGLLRDSALVVTNETDTVALAAVAGSTNALHIALTNEALYRAQGDAQTQASVVSSTGTLHIALSARIDASTNAAAISQTNLLNHFNVLVAEERAARSTNVSAWGSAILLDSRDTNAVTRAIASAALSAAQSVTGSQATAFSQLHSLSGTVASVASQVSSDALSLASVQSVLATNKWIGIDSVPASAFQMMVASNILQIIYTNGVVDLFGLTVIGRQVNVTVQLNDQDDNILPVGLYAMPFQTNAYYGEVTDSGRIVSGSAVGIWTAEIKPHSVFAGSGGGGESGIAHLEVIIATNHLARLASTNDVNAQIAAYLASEAYLQADYEAATSAASGVVGNHTQATRAHPQYLYNDSGTATNLSVVGTLTVNGNAVSTSSTAVAEGSITNHVGVGYMFGARNNNLAANIASYQSWSLTSSSNDFVIVSVPLQSDIYLFCRLYYMATVDVASSNALAVVAGWGGVQSAPATLTTVATNQIWYPASGGAFPNKWIDFVMPPKLPDQNSTPWLWIYARKPYNQGAFSTTGIRIRAAYPAEITAAGY